MFRRALERDGTGQVLPAAPTPVEWPPQERLFKPVVVESEAKTANRLASDLRKLLREGWPARIRVYLVAATASLEAGEDLGCREPGLRW